MSSLPLRARLEHLRHEAKQRLKAMRAQDPAARLAEAQLAVARDYGFASWRRLKAALDEQIRARAFAAAPSVAPRLLVPGGVIRRAARGAGFTTT